LQTGSEDTAMAFGKRNLHPQPLAKRIKLSNQLLRQAMIGPEALVIERLGYKFAVTQEKAFLTGSGVISRLACSLHQPVASRPGETCRPATARRLLPSMG
jgi:HK97 family phage major capsid protein